MPEKELNVGLIGYGYWGKNLLRNLIQQKHFNKIIVCDNNEKRIAEMKSLYFNVEATSDTSALLNDPSINAVVIATPTTSHFELAKLALQNGKHVLVEKPLATSIAEVHQLIELAKEKKLVLMVDHIYLYNPVVKQLKQYISNNLLGEINYIDSTRINLGIYQDDINVLWDLACHDISIINYLIEEKPQSVRAIGKLNLKHNIEDVAYLFLQYHSGLLIQINCSWASPVKMRKMIIGGEKKMIIYDDIESTNKLIIYDYAKSQIEDENKSKLIDYRLGDITIPKYEIAEPLKSVIDEFFDCILNGKQPLANGQNALEVVRILENAQTSVKTNGAVIQIV